MFFAYETDDRTLSVYDTLDAIISQAEPVDVAAGNWLFFDSHGQLLDPQFGDQGKLRQFALGPGAYTLTPTATYPAPRLLDLLPNVRCVEGKLSSVHEVRMALTCVGADTRRDSV